MRALVLVLLVGCVGEISGEGDKGLTPQQKHALDMWTQKAQPAFTQATCISCHDGSMPGIGYLAGATTTDIRDTILAFSPKVVSIDSPQGSYVLNKGKHEGPPLSVQQFSDILTWIQAEADAQNGMITSTAVQTTPYTVNLCTGGAVGSATCPVNTVDISAIANAPALPGAHIDFVVQPVSNAMYFTQVTATAGADGLYVEHPLFLYLPPTGTMCADGTAPPCPDSIDRFYNIQLNVMSAGSQPLGSGGQSFAGFTPVSGAQLQIAFTVVDKYHP